MGLSDEEARSILTNEDFLGMEETEQHKFLDAQYAPYTQMAPEQKLVFLGKLSPKPSPLPVEQIGEGAFPQRAAVLGEGVKAAGRELPIIAGETAGGALMGGPVGAVLPAAMKGSKAVRLILKALGSGVGAFGGAQVSQELPGGENLNPTQEGAISAATEAGLPIAGKIAKKVGGGALELARKTTFAGDIVTKKIRKKLVDDTTKDSMKFINEVLPNVSVKDAASQVGDIWLKKTNWDEAFKEFNPHIEDLSQLTNDQIPVFEVQDFLENKVQEFMGQAGQERTRKEAIARLKNFMGFSPTKLEGRVIDNILDDGALGGKDIRFLLKDIWKSFPKDPSKNVKFKEDLKRIFKDELDVLSPGAKAAKDKGDQIFGATSEFIKKNPAIKTRVTDMSRASGGTVPLFKDKPEVAVDGLWAHSSPENLTSLKQELISPKLTTDIQGGAQAWESLKFNWLRALYEGSSVNPRISGIKSAIQTSEAGKKTIRPLVFVENVDANADKIRSVFPEESRNIFRQRDKMLEVSEDFIKLEEAGQEGVSSFARRGAGGAAASLVLSPQVAIPLAEASGAIAAWTLLSPTSKKLLKQIEGIGGKFEPIFRGGVKAGSRFGGRKLRELFNEEAP